MAALAQAAWPSQHIPEPVKTLIVKFYVCVDAPLDPDSNAVLANDVFHPDASFQINKRVIRGRNEIAHWRDSAASGSGAVISILSLSADGFEVLTTGTLVLEMGDGRKADSEFTCRCLVTKEKGEGAKIKEWRGWVDYVPFLKGGPFEKARVYDAERP
ncbi:hypothetical protein LTR95_007567 [Oleoguttula sp. CCFEE 5521]